MGNISSFIRRKKIILLKNEDDCEIEIFLNFYKSETNEGMKLVLLEEGIKKKYVICYLLLGDYYFSKKNYVKD